MVDDVAEEGQVLVLRIVDQEGFVAVLGLQMDGGVGEDGERDLPTVADDEDAVFLGTLMRHETPSPGGRHTIGKAEDGAHGIFRGIEAAAVGRDAVGFDDGAEEKLEKVDLVRSEVVEVAAAGNVGLETPRQISGVVV